MDGITHVWVEEAQSVSEESWQILIPTIREENSEIICTFNPTEEDDPTFKRFVVNPPATACVLKINWQDNPFFPNTLREEMLYDKASDYDKYLHVWEGECKRASDAQIFRGKVEVRDFDLPDDLHEPYNGRRIYWGADWGFSQDPSTLIGCYIMDGVLYVFAEAYAVGVELNNLAQLYAPVYLQFKNKWVIYADNSRPETINHLSKHVWNVSYEGKNVRFSPPVEAADKWSGSVQDGIEYLRSFKKIIVHTNCKHTAQEFKFYKYKVDKKTGEVLAVIEDKQNHCIDALRYALDKEIQSEDLGWTRAYED
jgi:phage terminase large subunit